MVTKHSVSIDPKLRVVWIYKETRHGKKSKMFWNMSSFRPSMETLLTKGVRYRGVVVYDTQNLPSGKAVRIPKSIKVGTKTYCNMI